MPDSPLFGSIYGHDLVGAEGPHSLHMLWPYGMQDWTIRSLYRYISIYLYLILNRSFPFPSMSVFVASIQGRVAFLGTPLCWVWDRKGGRAGASAPPSWCCWSLKKLNTLQLRPLKCIPCLCLLVVILEKKLSWCSSSDWTQQCAESVWWWSEQSS